MNSARQLATTLWAAGTVLVSVCGMAPAAPFDPARIPAEAWWYVHGGKDFFDTLSKVEDFSLFGLGETGTIVLEVGGKLPREKTLRAFNGPDSRAAGKHRGIKIFQAEDTEDNQYAAFSGEDLAVFASQRDAMLHALDVLSGHAPHMKIPEDSGNRDALLEGWIDLKRVELDENSQVLKNSEGCLVRLFEKDGVILLDVHIRGDTAMDAHLIAKFLKIMPVLIELSYAREKRKSDPESGSEFPDIQCRVRRTGKFMVHACYSMAIGELPKLVDVLENL